MTSGRRNSRSIVSVVIVGRSWDADRRSSLAVSGVQNGNFAAPFRAAGVVTLIGCPRFRAVGGVAGYQHVD